MPSVIKALEDAGYIAKYKDPDELKKEIAENISVIEKVLKAAELGKIANNK